VSGAGGPARLEDFAGRWRLTRRIADALAGAEGRLEGWAEFRPVSGGLVCEEKGLLSYGGGPPLQASRSYLWRAEAPGRIAVSFEDGRPFHVFALGPAAEAAHDCAPDRYHVAYDFSRWPAWRAVWTVTGPRKDYVSVSEYLPEAGAGGGI
jgi:hypothetical protein